jgi:glycopeptide antibiotics resistance protein
MRLGEFMTVPWFLPGVGVSVVLVLLLGKPIGRALGVGRNATAALIVSLGIILSATLTPLRPAIDFGATGSGVCDLSRVGLAPLGELLRFHDAGLNVLMFIPLGVTIGLFPRSRRTAAFAAAAIALPFVIETIQLLLPVLDRACESADAFDNLTGLVVGLAGGAVAGRLLAPARRPDG